MPPNADNPIHQPKSNHKPITISTKTNKTLPLSYYGKIPYTRLLILHRNIKFSNQFHHQHYITHTRIRKNTKSKAKNVLISKT